MLDFTLLQLKQVDKLFFEYLWGSKRHRIARNTMTGDYCQGGIKMVDVFVLNKALKAAWSKRLLNHMSVQYSVKPSWTLIPYLYFRRQNLDSVIFYCNFTKPQDCPDTGSLPPFYKEMILNLHESFENQVEMPETPESLLKQVIWANKFFRFKNKTLFFPDWVKSGIIFVNDIVRGNEIDFDKITNLLKNRRNYISEFYMLSNALKPWRRLLYDDHSQREDISLDKNFIHKIKVKSIYCNLISKLFKKSYVENMWNNKCGIQQEKWNFIWGIRCTKCALDKKLCNFIFKFIHYILPTGGKLFKWKLRPSPLCDKCHVLENQQHIFFHCITVQHFWDKIRLLIRKYFDIDPILNMKSLIEGSSNKTVNHIISIAMYSIYKAWCQDLNVYYIFQRDLKICILCEGYISKSQARRKWKDLYFE